jgi:sensor histidine kinase YesM
MTRVMINSPLLRIIQHVLFWLLSFYVFLYVFKVGSKPQEIDYVYTAIFHVFILPPVYINLLILIPWVRRTNSWKTYFTALIVLIAVFSWINQLFFARWSNFILPDYFFISYFTFFQVSLFFICYLGVSSLLKLSKSWFMVCELQNRLLAEEKKRADQEKELVELEARALRAQMNPHFIFNCMNSIKSLMQERQIEKGVVYLTTLSKLIRTLFNNADKKEISLYDEVETCKLYLKLEAMRFESKLSYEINIDSRLDLKSLHVPALIIQPFIENAIWHGIVPKVEGGKVELNVRYKKNGVEIIVDDNGIGREASRLNKSGNSIMHQSKGINLTQSRLKLDNLLRQREAKLETIDKIDEGAVMGTMVMITLTEDT